MQWYQLDNKRFELEKELLRRYYPGSKIIIEHGIARVEKALISRQDVYLLKGIYPSTFPYSPMHVYIDSPDLEKTPPHLFNEGRLCLHGPNDVGPQTSAKIYLDWAKQWILIYERWLRGVPWPKTNISQL